MNLGLAIHLAAGVHQHQRDKANEHYILHCLAVMEMVRPHGEEAMIVAILHDSFEDFDAGALAESAFRYKVRTEFTIHVYDAIDAMSHRGGEPYDEYIERVAQNYLARIVKIADLTHNMDPRRIPADQIVDKDFARWDKYRRALIRLTREA